MQKFIDEPVLNKNKSSWPSAMFQINLQHFNQSINMPIANLIPKL